MSLIWGSMQKRSDIEIRAILLNEPAVEDHSDSHFLCDWTWYDWGIMVAIAAVGWAAMFAVWEMLG